MQPERTEMENHDRCSYLAAIAFVQGGVVGVGMSMQEAAENAREGAMTYGESMGGFQPGAKLHVLIFDASTADVVSFTASGPVDQDGNRLLLLTNKAIPTEGDFTITADA